MIFPQTRLNVIDNSGIRSLLCVRVLMKKYNFAGKTACCILGVVLSTKRNKKFFNYKKGDLVRAFVINTVKNTKVSNGITYSFFSNNCLVLDKNINVIGTRISVPGLYSQIQKSSFVTNPSLIIKSKI